MNLKVNEQIYSIMSFKEVVHKVYYALEFIGGSC